MMLENVIGLVKHTYGLLFSFGNLASHQMHFFLLFFLFFVEILFC